MKANPVRPFYWSVRRELWESRSITLAPLSVAAVLLLGFLVSVFALPGKMAGLAALDPAAQRAAVQQPYALAAGLIFTTAFLVGAFYCLDALYGERRDRSVLFWRSMPVRDTTAVLSKAAVPLVVVPLVAFPVIVATQLAMLLVSALVLLGGGPGPDLYWARLPLPQMTVALAYALVAGALWYAPIFGWLLLVSAWARRVPFVWAVLPPLAIAAVERMAFGGSAVADLLKHRVVGWFTGGFAGAARNPTGLEPLQAMTPGTFLTTPGLYLGLAFAAACLALAVRLRRGSGRG